jgi:hypothetical protein
LADGETAEAILSWDDAVRLAMDMKSTRKKIIKAMKHISEKEKVGLFVKRAVSDFAGIDVANGLVKITVCEPQPCFETKAQFSYANGDELRVEIPGPLTGPVMLLTKKHGLPAKYGAIHPQFQTLEFYVTRAFDRIESLLSSDVFRGADIAQLGETAVEKSGVLSTTAGPLTVRFDANSGAVKQLEWSAEKQSDQLKAGAYEPLRGGTLPKFLEWQDTRTGFLIRVDFLKPAVSSPSNPRN